MNDEQGIAWAEEARTRSLIRKHARVERLATPGTGTVYDVVGKMVYVRWDSGDGLGLGWYDVEDLRVVIPYNAVPEPGDHVRTSGGSMALYLGEGKLMWLDSSGKTPGPIVDYGTHGLRVWERPKRA